MSEVRAFHKMGNYLYAVIGSKFYRISSDKVKTPLGTIGTSSGKAWIRGDGTNLCVVDGTLGYYGVTGLSQITFPDSFAPGSLAYMDGYFIVHKAGTARFYISTSYDPSAWSASDYATAEGHSDNLVTVFVHNRDLWLMGEETTEIWFNSGDATFPFERYQGGFITTGCRAARSVAASDERVFWLDNDLRVRMGIGVQSQIISTPQIDYQIAQLTGHVDSVGFFYMQEGHGFYQLTIDTKTLVYDVSTNYWHTRASGASDGRHPAQVYAYFNDEHIVGHYSNGRIYSFDLDAYTNDGEVMRAIRAAQTVHSERKRVFHNRLEIEFEAGVGNTDCPNPVAALDWSDDDGHTFISTPKERSIGANGAYTSRAVWNRLGASRGRVYRVTIDDPVKRVIVSAHLEAGKGGD